MDKDGMDWCKFYSSVSFDELRSLSPELRKRRNPTCYSRDGGFVNISSQDDYFSTKDESSLRSVIQNVKASYTSSINRKPIDIKEAYLTREDFLVLCEILYTLTGDEEFADTDSALNNPE